MKSLLLAGLVLCSALSVHATFNQKENESKMSPNIGEAIKSIIMLKTNLFSSFGGSGSKSSSGGSSSSGSGGYDYTPANPQPSYGPPPSNPQPQYGPPPQQSYGPPARDSYSSGHSGGNSYSSGHSGGDSYSSGHSGGDSYSSGHSGSSGSSSSGSKSSGHGSGGGFDLSGLFQIPIKAIGTSRSAVNSVFDAKIGIFKSIAGLGSGGGKH